MCEKSWPLPDDLSLQMETAQKVWKKINNILMAFYE